MRKLVFFLMIFLLGAISVQSQQKGRQFQVFGVCFYNLENFFDTINNNGKYDLEFSPQGSRQWNGEKYRSKLKNMSFAISQMTSEATPMGPAVIGVSEVENRSVLDDLVKQESIRKWHLQIVHHDTPDLRGIDVALLYNPRFFRVLSVINTPLFIPSNPTFRTRTQMCVTGMLGNDKVSIIVNHWPSRLGGEERSSYLREAAAARAKQTADSLLRIDPNQGIIIMGDLNDDPQNRSCSEVIGAKRDKQDVTEFGFYNPWWSMLDKGIGTLCYRGSWNLFDQIMISGYFLKNDKKHLTFLKNEVLNKQFLMNTEGQYKGYPLRTYAGGVFLNGYSDHFPTEVFFYKEIGQ
jgi:hypothetical protein